MSPRTKRIIAFDLGLSTGIAEYRSARVPRIVHETLRISGGRKDRAGARYVRFREGLLKTLNRRGRRPDLVVFEDVKGHKGTAAAHVYGALLGQLLTECELLSVPYRGVPVKRYRKYLVGNGNATKEDLQVTAETILEAINGAAVAGYFENNQDEADAVCLLYYAMKKYIILK